MPRGRQAEPKTLDGKLELIDQQITAHEQALTEHKEAINTLKERKEKLLQEKKLQDFDYLQQQLQEKGISLEDLLSQVKPKE